MKKKIRPSMLGIIALASMAIISITLSKYISTLNKTITLNVRKPEYIVNFYRNVLPDEYQEVEYIESTGTQYIDTGYYASAKTRAIVEFSYTQSNGDTYSNGFVFGSANEDNGRPGVSIGIGKDDSIFYRNSDMGESFKSPFVASINTKYRMETYKNDIKINNTIYTSSMGLITQTSRYSSYLFARHQKNSRTNTGYAYSILIGKIYFSQLYEDDILVRNFIPCYRKVDGIIGMYDTVNDVFYTNAGTGVFSKGNDVIATQQFTYGTAQNLTANTYIREGYKFTGWNTELDGSGTSYADEEEVLNLSSTDGDVINLYAQWRPNTYTVNFNNNRLPEEYQEVEYIQSTGTQYIDTGLTTNGEKLTYETSIKWEKNGSRQLLGANQGQYFGINADGNYQFGHTDTDSQISASTDKFDDVKVDYFYDSSKHSEYDVNGQKGSYSRSYSLNQNIAIFALGDRSQRFYTSSYVRYFKILFDDKLVRDFVPCYRKSDGAIGMYDLVANTFYTNNGTGTFDKGQDIKDTQQFTYGKEQNLKANTFTREGYTFAGWNTKPDGSGTSYEDEEEVLNLSSIDGDVINLYAQWTASTYTVTLNPGTDGTLPGKTQGQTDTTSVTYNSTYGTLPAPTREGYTFDGWFTAETGGDKIESSTTVTTAANNQTLWAHWTEKMQGLYIGETSITTLDLDGAILLSAVSTDTPSLTTNSSYTWESSNRNIADVTTEGIVKCSTNTSSDLGGTTAVITCKNSSGVIVGQVTVTSTSKILNTTTNTTTENINKNRRISGSEAYNNPTIPAGYQAINTNDATWTTEETQTNVNNGLTIMDNRGNQFVWVPVPNAIYDATDATNNGGMLTSYTPVANMAGTYTPMAIQIGTNYKSLPYEYNEAKGIRLYYPTGTNYQGTTNPYKEPDVLSSTGNGDWSTKANRGLNLIVKHINEYKTKKVGTDNNSIKEGWTNQLIGEYDDMIRQVSSYEGFWVGRYEESWDDSQNKIAVIAGARSANGDHDNTQTWYGLYQKPKDYGENNSYYASSMIYGSQYDAMMNWMAKNGNNVIKANDDNRNRTRITGNPTTTYSNNDKINNIMDIYGNSQEWTQEAWGTADRAYRGGTYSISRRPGYRYTNYTYQANTNYGSRPALCLK